MLFCDNSVSIPADFAKRSIHAYFAFNRPGSNIKTRSWFFPKELSYNIPQCWPIFRIFNCI